MKAPLLLLSGILGLLLFGCETNQDQAEAQVPLISPTRFEQRYELDQIHDSLTDNFSDRTQIVPEQFPNLIP